MRLSSMIAGAALAFVAALGLGAVILSATAPAPDDAGVIWLNASPSARPA